MRIMRVCDQRMGTFSDTSFDDDYILGLLCLGLYALLRSHSPVGHDRHYPAISSVGTPCTYNSLLCICSGTLHYVLEISIFLYFLESSLIVYISTSLRYIDALPLNCNLFRGQLSSSVIHLPSLGLYGFLLV
ncbi:hypothetical protein F5890DRAFT_1186727 [Lentinula detonsa]|uniref:Uncharacterized protein n=1 Tax=Lentinula detonsa TaxID=2804962 RepID=A0AA38UYA3_9AGAR|nr:hypothetical protein F5890DRAFT_1186727 [Lentinula detonsa]